MAEKGKPGVLESIAIDVFGENWRKPVVIGAIALLGVLLI